MNLYKSSDDIYSLILHRTITYISRFRSRAKYWRIARITVDPREWKIEHTRRQALRDANWAREAHSVLGDGARATLHPIGRRVEIFVWSRGQSTAGASAGPNARFSKWKYFVQSRYFFTHSDIRERYIILYKKKRKKLIFSVFCKYKYFQVIFYIVIFKKLRLNWKIKLKD